MAAMSFLFVVAFAVVVVGLGSPLVAWLDNKRRLTVAEHVGASFLIGCYPIYFIVFAVGPFRLDAITMWLLAVACVAGAAAGYKWFPRAELIHALHMSREKVCEPWCLVLVIATLAVGLSSLVQGQAPPNDYDSLMYHLTYPLRDVEIGRITVPWARDAGTQTALFPAMMGHLSRFALATMDSGAAQGIHGLFGLVAALGAASLVRRLGCTSFATQVLAALLFLSVRAVIWEMATVEVDVALAAWAIHAILVYLAWRKSSTFGLGVVFGLLIGGGILSKYHGFAVALSFAPLLLIDLIRARLNWRQAVLGPAIAFAVIVPHGARNFLLTGNPVFPIFNHVFNPGKPRYFEGVELGYGTGRSVLDLITTLWHMFVSPMHYFDGMVFGAPYLLAFAPLILLNRDFARRALPVLSIALDYYAIWFWFLSQQVRFLIPVIPVLSALAASGLAAWWAVLQGRRWLQALAIAVVGIFALNAAAFVGIYTALRLPVAVGIVSPATYLGKTPTMDGALYATCSYIRERLVPGERYFSYLGPVSFYCPQAAVTLLYFDDEGKWWLDSKVRPQMSFDDFVKRLEAGRYRFFLLPLQTENRRNETAEQIRMPVDLSEFRFGTEIARAIDGLAPLVSDTYSQVYDGAEILSRLKEQRPR